MKTFFVFDVESIGLHGEGYAVAGGVYFEDGTVEADSEFVLACAPENAEGSLDDRAWIAENVPHLEPTHETPDAVRYEFWNLWMSAKIRHPKIVMAAECAWPVEAGFLSACIRDKPEERHWQGPYPLHEIASYMTAAGMDPMATYDRLQSEEPKHHPLGDARQSSRLLCEALDVLSERTLTTP